VIEQATIGDYATIVGALHLYWEDAARAPMHHPLLVREFGDLSLVIRDAHGVQAYLFGLLATAEPAGYVHIVGVRQDQRRRGHASALYAEFAVRARERGAAELKAITKPGNTRSRAFHAALGFDEEAIDDYSGPGEDRILFRRGLR
jgi:L-amino acid N-acyltransferase YncA